VVEHSAVNRVVARSSRAGGAKKSRVLNKLFGTLFVYTTLNSDSVLVVFTKCENAGIESFLFFLQKQMIEGLPVICEPFSTASAAGRETTPPMTVKGTVNDL